jgi:predicted DNA-binding transcriptional regulator AlpA
METYSFTLVIAGDAGTDERINELFEAGCDDATFSHSPTISYGDFDREDDTLLDAVLSAIGAVESVEGLRVRRVETDDLVTAPEIAGRLGRTRQSVYQLVNGERGAGDFPAPLSSARGRGKVWDWSEVAVWAGVDFDRARAATMAAVNAALALRHARSSLDAKPMARLLGFAAA